MTAKEESTCWSSILENAPSPLNFTYLKCLDSQNNSLIKKNIHLERPVYEDLKKLGEKIEINVDILLISALEIILSHYSNQNNLIIAVALEDKCKAELGDLSISHSLVSTELSFINFARYVNRNLLRFSMPKETRNLTFIQPFQILVIFKKELENMLSISPEIKKMMLSQNHISFAIDEGQKTLSIEVQYNSHFIEKDILDRMLNHWFDFLKEIDQNHEKKIGHIPILTAQEEKKILQVWNSTEAAFPKNKTIHLLIEEQAKRSPDAVAICYQDNKLTYSELNSKANQLAYYLIDYGINPEELIGIAHVRSLDLIVSILAILKAGAAYVPLDLNYPTDRLYFIVEYSHIRLIITEEKNANIFKKKCKVIQRDVELNLIENYPKTNPKIAISSLNLAYVLFTSGSTGKPKGVQIAHQSIVNHAYWYRSQFHITADDKSLQFASFAFDAFGCEVWPFLMVGATVYLVAEETRNNLAELSQFIAKNQITVIDVPTALGSLLVEQIDPHCHLRLCKFGGEALQHFPQATGSYQIWNTYGPTESTIEVSAACISASGGELRPPIGRPGANIQLYILDKHLQLCAVGIPGELYIAGSGLARGYLNRPDLTAERFIANPWSKLPGERMYKSGDLCCYLPDGNIHYLGRIDNQVKIHGFRIELGEIEANLKRHPLIQSATVIAREDIPGEKRLVAYVIAASHSTITAENLKEFLHTNLPSYMIPSAFVFLNEFPLTPNKKIDHKALPIPSYSSSQSYVAPTTPMEQNFCTIYQEVLAAPQVGLVDNFFELGGHSLSAAIIAFKLSQLTAKKITWAMIYNKPTIAELIADLSEENLEFTVDSLPLPEDFPDAFVPLNAVQSLIWLASKNNPNAKISYVYDRRRFAGSINLAAFDYAFVCFFKRHVIFSYTANTSPELRKSKKIEFAINTIDLRQLSADEKESGLINNLEKIKIECANKAEAPLLVCDLCYLENDEIELQICFAHILGDELTANVIFNDLSKYYLDYNEQLLIQKLQPDYAFRQKVLEEKNIKLKEQKEDLQFWENYLQNVTYLNFNEEELLHEGQNFSTTVEFPTALLEKINRLCKEKHIGIYDLITAAACKSVEKYRDRSKPFAFNVVNSARDRENYANSVGVFLTNTLLKVHLEKGDLLDLAKEVRQSKIDTQSHSQCSNVVQIAASYKKIWGKKKILSMFLTATIATYCFIFKRLKINNQHLFYLMHYHYLSEKNKDFLLNVDILNNFVEIFSDAEQHGFGLKKVNIPWHCDQHLDTDNSVLIEFARADNHQAFITVNARLSPTIRQQIGQSIIEQLRSCNERFKEKYGK